MPCCVIALCFSAARAIWTRPSIRPSRGSWARSFRTRPCRRSPALKRSSISTPRTSGRANGTRTVAAYETLPPVLRGLADQLWALHSNVYDYGATRPNATTRQVQRYETVFKSTVYETEHPVVQVHPLTGERAIILGFFVRKVLGVSSVDSAHLFAMLQDHVTRLENMVRWRWSAGDVVIWDNRATQHKAIDDYGKEPRIVRRVTIEGPVSVGIDGRHGKRRNSDAQVAAAAA